MPKEFTVPGEPVAKARPRFNRKSGTAYTPTKSARFEDRVRLCAINAGIEPIDGPVALSIKAFWPSRKPDRKREPRLQEWRVSRPDIDNVVKACFDGLQGVASSDDAQVASLHAQKFRAAQGEPPRVEIQVVPL